MNRLAHETSPYLRQHADNPVDWYPWGDEAFARARADDKPLLLSVGYSSCHWCHVMAHESFEDDATAALMNDRFVNVKVDREERPDVDAVYMQAVQAMTGSGGWPMTVFLDHEGRPFFGGTYFPSEDRQGMPSFRRLLDAVDEAWRERRDDLREQAEQLHQAIAESTTIGALAGVPVTTDVFDDAVANLREQFDARFGGFGRAPKFPQAMTLTFLLDLVAGGSHPDALDMVTTSLDAMAAGGLYDQVGGGLPPLLGRRALARAPLREDALRPGAARARLPARVDGHRPRALPARGRGDRRLRPARPPPRRPAASSRPRTPTPKASRASSTSGRSRSCGSSAATRADDVIRHFGVTARGNFEDPHTGFRGNILHAVGPTDERPASVSAVLPTLFGVREQRVRPGLDDKVLLGWNALFLRSLVEAAHAFARDDWMDVARANARFLLDEMRRDDGRLLRSWQDGRANLLAYAEDHAALARGAADPGRARRRHVVGRGAQPSPTRWCGSSPTTSAAGSSPPGPTPTR